MKEDAGIPVGTTSVPGKIMEQITLAAVERHLGILQTSGSYQSFTKGKSSLTDLISFYDMVTGLMGERKDVDVVFLD